MTAAPEPLVSEERVRELALRALQKSCDTDTVAAAIRTAVREAGEAAAKVCREQTGPRFGRGDAAFDAACETCYLAIRSRLP